MARKHETTEAVEVVEQQPKTGTLMIELRVTDPAGYCPQNFHFNVTNRLSKTFRMLKDSLHNSGATFDDGNGNHHVDSDADVFRYLLASVVVS